MKQKYALSKRAERDLIGIMAAFEEIAKAPAFLGCSYDHVRSGYRKYPIGKHVIFYQIQASGVVLISRVLHEKMDYDRHL